MNSNPFVVIKGKVPVIFTAPHGVNHSRPSIDGVTRQGELFTSEMVEQLCDQASAHGLLTKEQNIQDPNYYPEDRNPFKKALRQSVSENELKYLFDIHGLSSDKNYDIGLIFTKRYYKSHRTAEKLIKYLDQGELKGISVAILNFPEGERYESLSQFATKVMKIPAVQIEIARYLREERELREQLVNNISNFILTL